MSAKSIREYHGKKLTSRWLSTYSNTVKYDLEDRALLITPNNVKVDNIATFDALAVENPWYRTLISKFILYFLQIANQFQGFNDATGC